MRILGINNALTFQRRPRKDEEPELRSAINQAYKVMGTTDRVVITHGSCFPALDRDTFIGSPYGKSAREYTKFLMLYGFNGNQLGPCGELGFDEKGISRSPYSASAFANNRLFIDLEELTTDKYGKILSKDTYKKVTKVPEITDNNYTQSDFDRAVKIYDIALSESYKTFKLKLKNGQPEAVALNKEYRQFLSKHNFRLLNEGIFKVLSEYYGTDDFEKWENPVDEDLIRLAGSGNIDAQKRYADLIKYNRQKIDLYRFEQFIISKQIKENKEWRDEKGFKYFNDLLVGCSKMDYWRCRDAFIDGYQLGVPMGNGNNPQIWNLPVLNPRTLFEGDGLGTAGQFLKDKLDFALEYCENIRVDHAMGLIEPFVIENNSIVYDENKNPINNPYQNPINGRFMSEMYSSDGKKLDDYKNYSCDYTHWDGGVTYHSNIMNKIVLPALKEHGINPQDAVWEDICCQPVAFNKVFYENLHLPGLSQLEFSKVENNPENNWFVVGSHDSIPAQNMIKRDWTRNGEDWNIFYLAGYLNMDSARANERNAFCEKIDKDDKERVKAKFAELMTTRKFQISFADLLGITDTLYNNFGTRNDTNWKERITSDYLDKYYENLASEYPTAINIPEVLKMALQAKIDMRVVKSENPDKTRAELNAKYRPLLDSLQKYADILKEPE
ncbi:4-alpha-glucanotransferase [bacterium]|nr:4-alpha-glucanotransferase [bacterium]